MQSQTVAICEDDAALRSVLVRALEGEGLTVIVASAGRDAVERFSSTPVDALVLDIGLPDADGRDVCQALRAHGVSAPVLFLTARGALTDRLSGFQAGGDDYLTKPFAVAELLARIAALLKRAAPPPPTVGTMLLDPSAHCARVNGRQVPLTPTEFRIVAKLAAEPGAVVRRRDLVLAAWPHGAIVHDNTLDTYVKRLRSKLRELETEAEIVTVRGVGYTLQ